MGMAFVPVYSDTSAFVIYTIVSQTCMCIDCSMVRGHTQISRALSSLRDLTREIKQTDSKGAALWPGLARMPEWFDQYRLPAPLKIVYSIVRRVQERFPVAQRRARKRRRMIQSFAV